MVSEILESSIYSPNFPTFLFSPNFCKCVSIKLLHQQWISSVDRADMCPVYCLCGNGIHVSKSWDHSEKLCSYYHAWLLLHLGFWIKIQQFIFQLFQMNCKCMIFILRSRCNDDCECSIKFNSIFFTIEFKQDKFVVRRLKSVVHVRQCPTMVHWERHKMKDRSNRNAWDTTVFESLKLSLLWDHFWAWK